MEYKPTKKELLKTFSSVDLRNMSAKQLTQFVTPYIELAGFEWTINDEIFMIAKKLNK